MRLEFMGPPGAGKGTQAKRISRDHGIPHLSTGEMFRENIRAGTDLGREAQGLLARGALVPDVLVSRMVETRLEKDDCEKGYLLDGYPRTPEQVDDLDRMLEKRGWIRSAVVLIDVERDELVSRLASRRTCRSCGSVVNLAIAGDVTVCHDCGGELAQRDDDREEVVRERLDVYDRQTAPVLEIYRKRGILTVVDGLGTMDEVTARIEAALDKVVA